MTDEVLASEGGENVDLSTEELSTEIGTLAESEAAASEDSSSEAAVADAAEEIQDAIDGGADPEEIKEKLMREYLAEVWYKQNSNGDLNHFKQNLNRDYWLS